MHACNHAPMHHQTTPRHTKTTSIACNTPSCVSTHPCPAARNESQHNACLDAWSTTHVKSHLHRRTKRCSRTTHHPLGHTRPSLGCRALQARQLTQCFGQYVVFDIDPYELRFMWVDLSRRSYILHPPLISSSQINAKQVVRAASTGESNVHEAAAPDKVE